jgi:hypothetical protein
LSRTTTFNFDVKQSSSSTSTFPTPAPAACVSFATVSEPFPPSSQPTGFSSPPATFADIGAQGKSSAAHTKIVHGRPPLSPSTPNLASAPGNENAAGSEVVVGIAFKSWTAAAPEPTNDRAADPAVGATSLSIQPPLLGFYSNGSAATPSIMSPDGNGNNNIVNSFSFPVAPIPAAAQSTGSFQFPVNTLAASFNPAATAAAPANPFSSSFSAAGLQAGSQGFFAAGAPPSSTTSRRKVFVRGKK